MTDPQPQDLAPLIIAVAPNGARRTHADHAGVPVGPAEMAETAARCLDAGACMLHLHVRDAEGRHLLDAGAYAEATAAVRDRVGDRMIVQITTEAVGHYTPDQQMAVVRAVRPEAVSVAVRELVADAAAEPAAAAFFAELAEQGVLVQHILYSAEDVARFRDLRARGVIAAGTVCPLFVLGRYTAGLRSDPADLLPFLAAWEGEAAPWAMCAFGPREAACATAAMAFGGHVRVGFENNLWLPDGRVAADNAALVEQVVQAAFPAGRKPADAETARTLLKA